MMRWLRFNAVGMMGMAVQLILIAVLVRVFKMHYLPATALAVEVAILHNFLWHVRWTWPDRPLVGLFTLFRFNVAVGVVSIRLLLGPYHGIAQYDYIMTAKVRLLLFWVGADDVGGGYIRRSVSTLDPSVRLIQVLIWFRSGQGTEGDQQLGRGDRSGRPRGKRLVWIQEIGEHRLC